MLWRTIASRRRPWRTSKIFVFAPANLAIRSISGWLWEHLPSFILSPYLLRLLDYQHFYIWFRWRSFARRWFQSVISRRRSISFITIVPLIWTIIPTLVAIAWIIASISFIVVTHIRIRTSFIRSSIIVSRSRRLNRRSRLRSTFNRAWCWWWRLGLEHVRLRRSSWSFRSVRGFEVEADLWSLRRLRSWSLRRRHILLVDQI